MLLTTAAAEEIKAYAAIATVSSELDGIFPLNEQHGKAFSAFFFLLTTMFCFTPDWIWQEFHENMLVHRG